MTDVDIWIPYCPNCQSDRGLMCNIESESLVFIACKRCGRDGRLSNTVFGAMKAWADMSHKARTRLGVDDGEAQP